MLTFIIVMILTISILFGAGMALIHYGATEQGITEGRTWAVLLGFGVLFLDAVVLVIFLHQILW